MQAFWTISIYLEALAILPQLILLQRYREVENLTSHYVFLLGMCVVYGVGDNTVRYVVWGTWCMYGVWFK